MRSSQDPKSRNPKILNKILYFLSLDDLKNEKWFVEWVLKMKKRENPSMGKEKMICEMFLSVCHPIHKDKIDFRNLDFIFMVYK